MGTFDGREITGIDILNYAIVFISWNKTARLHYLPSYVVNLQVLLTCLYAWVCCLNLLCLFWSWARSWKSKLRFTMMLEMLAIHAIFNLLRIFFFFSEQYATCRAYTSKWDVRQDGRQSREDPACSTKKVCAFMRVDAGHFPEFNCYQCAAAKSL